MNRKIKSKYHSKTNSKYKNKVIIPVHGSAKKAKRAAFFKKLKTLLSALAALIVAAAGLYGYVLPELFPKEEALLLGPYPVASVSDGDTINVTIEGGICPIRLIGVDTPESVHPDADRNVPEGTIASDYTKALLSGRQVWLEYGEEPEDQYGRSLCYVYLDGEGKTMVQELLLKDGMASVMTVPPNVKYEDRFLELQKKAREEKAGFWAEDVF